MTKKTNMPQRFLRGMIGLTPVRMIPRDHGDGDYDIPAADAAKLVRRQLRYHFKGVRFTVRTTASLNIYDQSIEIWWIDGPTDTQVREVVQEYTWQAFTGRGNRYLVKHMMTQRLYRDAAFEQIKAMITDLFGKTPATTMVSGEGYFREDGQDYRGIELYKFGRNALVHSSFMTGQPVYQVDEVSALSLYFKMALEQKGNE